MSRRLITVAAGLALLVGGMAGAGAYLLGTGLQAHKHLIAAQAGMQVVPGHLQRGDVAAARQQLSAVGEDTARARELTSGSVWQLAAAVPLVGPSVKSVSVLAATSDALARQVLPAAATAAEVLAVPADGSATSWQQATLQRLRHAAPELRAASDEAYLLREAVDGLPTTGVPQPLRQARASLLEQLDGRLLPAMRAATTVAQVAPGMLGTDGERRYFVALQNTAEARGTGGLPGVYVIVTADRGRLSLEHVGSAIELRPPVGPAVDLGAEHRERYAAYAASSAWVNAGLSPHFPAAGRTWTQLWARQSGTTVDGAIAVDPAVLDHLLTAIGPVRLGDGTVVRAGAVVPLTQEQAYVRFPDPRERKVFLGQIVQAVFARLTAAPPSPRSLGAALVGAAGEGRVKVFSTRPDEQRSLQGSAVGGVLPAGSGPLVLASVNNAFGNKLDYYLERRVTYHLGECSGGMRPSRVTITMSNTAPLGLDDYVTGRVEDHRRDRRYPYAFHRLLLSVFTTTGAQLRGASVDGQPVSVRASQERARPVYDLYLDLPRGATRTVVLDMAEPATNARPMLLEQPLVRPQLSSVRAAPCEVHGLG